MADNLRQGTRDSSGQAATRVNDGRPALGGDKRLIVRLPGETVNAAPADGN